MTVQVPIILTSQGRCPPEGTAPMLATAGTLPSGPDWCFEFKADGARGLLYGGRRQVRVMSRNHNDVTRAYPELAAVAELLDGRPAVLDGEIVAFDAFGRPSFARLQQRMHVTEPTRALLDAVPVSFYVFDLLRLDGTDLTAQPYATRRDLLAGLNLRGPHVRPLTSFVDVEGHAVLHAAEVAHLEGVVAKRLTSPYLPGKRSPDWIKVPLVRTQEVLIVGWRPGAGRRTGTLGALLLAVLNHHDQLVFAGRVGTGFTDADLRRLHERLEPLTRPAPPVAGVPREDARHARWVEPLLIGEVRFKNWTPDGRLRHPAWKGLRPDRDTTSVRRAPDPEDKGTVGAPSPEAKGTVVGAMQTPDGRWRVEAVRHGSEHSYRLVHDTAVVDRLAIATVERLLSEAGIDIADLIDI
jgi:bifunctional non-homologous end joining protein LigD